MKSPSFFLNPKAGFFFRLWRQERRENARLRRELMEWQGKLLQKANLTPLFTQPPKIEPIKQPPIGQSAKRTYLVENAPPNNSPSAEDILQAAQRANGR